MKNDDIEFEIQFYEGILKEKGDFYQVLVALGDLYTRAGRYQDGLAIDQKLEGMRPDDPIVLYNLACSYSLVCEVDKASETIKSAIQCGYDDFLYLESDEDLTNLLKTSRFKKYLKKIKASPPSREKKSV
ncbi:MAG: hypothetical protein KAJ18_08340 [Candidatus Omnitrophica bacterium]|nr:hypothetical protein [Candidatus Omnitrophota bacterium]